MSCCDSVLNSSVQSNAVTEDCIIAYKMSKTNLFDAMYSRSGSQFKSVNRLFGNTSGRRHHCSAY